MSSAGSSPMPGGRVRLGVADVVSLVRRRWLAVLLFGLGGLGATAAYYYGAARWYQAEVMLVPKQGSGGLGSALELLGGISLGLGKPNSDADRIAAILGSRSVTDGVIERFDLMRRYQVGKIEKARKRLWSLCSIAVEKRPKIIRLACEDEDPTVARDMADAFARSTDRGLRLIATASAYEERTFLERRVAEAERDLSESSRAVQRFQQSHGIVELDGQSKALISGMASLEGQVVSRRLALSYASGFASKREASIAQLRRQLAAIGAELRALEKRSADRPDVANGTGSILPPALEVPALRAELGALLREHEIRQTLFVMLSTRLEALEADGAQDVASFIVFDRAALPTRHIRPTLRILVPGFLAGLLLGVLFITSRCWCPDLRWHRPLVRLAGR